MASFCKKESKLNKVLLLELRHLSHQIQNRNLFVPISMTLQSGQLLQIFGDNGAGKSTLLKILAGLLKPEIGILTWHKQCNQSMAYLGHQNGLKGELSVVENLRLFNSFYQSDYLTLDHPFCQACFKGFGLEGLEQKKVNHMSFGQRRKLALMRLFLSKRKVWLLDEPLVGLDDKSVMFAANMLKQHCLGDNSVIMTTHQKYEFDQSLTTHEICLVAA